MATASQKVKVGIFLVIGIVLLAVAITATMGLSGKETKTYYIVFEESVGGLSAGSDVEYLGVEVGNVEDMSVTEEGLVRVRINVRPDKVCLRKGVKARLAPQGISGIMFIQLSGGGGRELDEGDTIGAQPSLFGSVDDIMEKINTTFDNLNVTLKDINEHDLVGDVNSLINDTDEAVNSLVSDIRTTLESVDRQIKDVGPSLRAALDSANAKIGEVDMRRINADLHEALVSIKDLALQASDVLDGFHRAGPRMQREMILTQHELDLTLQEMQAALTNMKRLARGIEEDPSALFHGKSPRER